MTEMDEIEPLNRRTVLKGMAAGAAAAGFPTAVTARSTDPGEELDGKRVFVEDGLDLHVPSGAQATGSLRNADVAFLAADSRVSRDRVVGALHGDTTTAFVGAGADDALFATLYDVAPSDAATLARNDDLTKADDLSSFRFGTEYLQNDDPGMAVASPVGDVINTDVYATNQERTREFVFEKMDKTLRQDSGDVGTSDHSYSCPDADSGWHCLGRSHYEKDVSPYGQLEKYVWGAYAVSEDDPYYDYYAWKVQQTSTPGIALGWSDYQNNFIWREVDFRNYYDLAKHGPDTTDGSSSSGFSVGVSVGAKSVSADLGYSWSTTYSHTKIEEVIDLTYEIARHKHDFKLGESVAKNTVSGYPGYRIDVDDGTSTVYYDHDNKWRWTDPCWWCGDDHYTYRLYGDGQWSS